LDLAVLSAVVFAVVTLGVIAFELALALGAPWGAYAMGGTFPGRFPAHMRIAAIGQAIILALVAFLVLSVAGVVAAPWGTTPVWVTWIIAALLTVGLVLNLITPSAGERRIWAPVVTLMLLCCIVVAVFG
jgi:hypothetical protein